MPVLLAWLCRLQPLFDVYFLVQRMKESAGEPNSSALVHS